MKIDELIHDLTEHADKITDQNYRDEGLDVRTAARLLRECHAAGFITDSGGVRRVLGTLPLTADGCIACQDSVIWHPTDGACYPVPDGLNVSAKVYGGARLVPTNECFKTREAAQTAREKN